jgi:hypothetical protein
MNPDLGKWLMQGLQLSPQTVMLRIKLVGRRKAAATASGSMKSFKRRPCPKGALAVALAEHGRLREASSSSSSSSHFQKD